MRRALLLLIPVLISSTVFAASVAGTWKGNVENGGRSMEVVLTAKTQGDALTGTVRLYGNDYNIQNGKIDGDSITFRSDSQYGTAVYEGTLKGDEIQLSISIGPGQDMSVVLKRVKQ